VFPEYKSARFRPSGGAGASAAQSVRGGAAASQAGIWWLQNKSITHCMCDCLQDRKPENCVVLFSFRPI